MRRPIVFMFSGQGSQYYGMGRELYERHTEFRSIMDHCDEILRPLLKTSLVEVLYDRRKEHEPFDSVRYTNPALLCIEYSLARLLMDMNIQPDYLLGYSLGEIAASVVAGALSLEDGIQFTVEFATLLAEETEPAEMLAVIESADVMTQFTEIFRNCWLTGRNFRDNFVVCGRPEDIQRLKMDLKKRGIVAQKLPVKYGFHTELMDPIEADFRQLVDRITSRCGALPVLSAQKADRIHNVDGNHFWDVIRLPVDFEKTIHAMLEKGDYAFVDVGPSGTLATCVKYLLPSHSGSIHLEVINQFGRNLKSIDKLVAGLSVDASA